MICMQRRKIFPLLCGVLFLVTVLLLSSCGEKQKEKSYDFRVTFNYNTGNLDVNCPNQYLGVKKGGLVGIQPGFNDDFKLVSVTNYYIEGWYTAKLSSDGTPEKDSQTGQVIVDKKWDFEHDTVSSDMTLYANLIRQSKLNFIDITTGTVIKTIAGTPGDKQNEPISVLAPKKDGHTLVGYYMDAEKKNRFEWPYRFGDADTSVYVDFIEGSWTLVDSAEALKRAISGNKNIYLTSDIDLSGITWVSTSFGGTIEGNGHKLTGLRIQSEGSKNKTRGFGVFTTIGASASIRNLTIENVDITFTASLAGNYQVAPLADEIRTGATFENFTVTGRLTYDFSNALEASVYPIAAVNGMAQADSKNCRFDIFFVNANSTQEN